MLQKVVSTLRVNTRVRGPLLILLSTVFYASHGVWSKFLAPYFDALSSSWSRSLIVVIILFPLVFVQKGFVKPKEIEMKWLAAIILPGVAVTPLYFYAFEHLSVGVATLVFFSCYTLGTLLYGRLFFNEALIRVKVVTLLLGLAGLGLVSVPYFQPGSLVAIFGCALAGLCGAAEITFTKKLPERYSPYYLTFLIYVVTAVITMGITLLVGSDMTLPVSAAPWLLSLGYAITIVAAIVLVIRGFKTIEPGVGGIIGLMEIVFGILFGVLIFSEQLTLPVSIGAACIFTAAFLTIISGNRYLLKRMFYNRW